MYIYSHFQDIVLCFESCQTFLNYGQCLLIMFDAFQNRFAVQGQALHKALGVGDDDSQLEIHDGMPFQSPLSRMCVNIVIPCL